MMCLICSVGLLLPTHMTGTLRDCIDKLFHFGLTLFEQVVC